jgi:hypothetical protein
MRTLIALAVLTAACATPGQKLDCRQPEAIREFKTRVLTEVNPTAGVDEKWAECLCGPLAKRAGPGSGRGEAPSGEPQKGFPGFPAWNKRDPQGSLERQKQFFVDRLGVDGEQAEILVECVWDTRPGALR